ncbi:Uncharacterised protein [uncultured Roseburia sp.]|uniref:Zn-finger containing protein n=1 Tax=Brotonthovivens ammoniilytica TaxID=2981725 RepID=A0ABT2TLE0_9FIRM|nr:hypothetical protein [Brotonthovivens ammoniilytica]MCU6763024.1 hypothetical protein [Brotonthovivens ammoniilytica]SCJ00802.1 Uncharacterised protein [uncultured Roseburia sp.]
MRERFERFMAGRYGMDQLSRFLDIAALILLIVSMFVRFPLIFYLAVILIVWSYFRIFSRNTERRYMENERFLSFTGRIFSRFRNRRYYQEQKKIYRYYACPKCRQKVRIPKGKGKVCITCPKCHMEFVRRS